MSSAGESRHEHEQPGREARAGRAGRIWQARAGRVGEGRAGSEARAALARAGQGCGKSGAVPHHASHHEEAKGLQALAPHPLAVNRIGSGVVCTQYM